MPSPFFALSLSVYVFVCISVDVYLYAYLHDSFKVSIGEREILKQSKSVVLQLREQGAKPLDSCLGSCCLKFQLKAG